MSSDEPPGWRRSLLAWVTMAGAMSMNGIFRVKVLVPQSHTPQNIPIFRNSRC